MPSHTATFVLLHFVVGACVVASCAYAQDQSSQAAQRPHYSDNDYYDRDAAHDAAARKKYDEEAKAKADEAMKKALAMPTPHLPDGRPDLSGIWITGRAG